MPATPDHDFQSVETKLNEACRKLMSDDRRLFDLDINERTLTQRLSLYLQALFPEYSVDCEYNRNLDDIKRLPIPPEEVRSNDINGVTVFPDIIVHKRESHGSNLLVIEAKKNAEIQKIPEKDCLKLKAFTDPGGEFKYAFGAFLNFVSRPGSPSFEITWLHGKPQDVSPQQIDLSERLKCWDAISRLALTCANRLRERVGLSETMFRRAAPFATVNSRAYYLYRILDEVQKAACSLIHWKDFLSGQLAPPPGGEREEQILRVVLEEQIDTQQLRSRKLIEALVELVLFGTTDEERYYRDYFLIREFIDHSHSQSDRWEFYASKNRNYVETLKFYLQGITRLESEGLDSSKRWYLKTKEPCSEKWLSSPAQLSSFRQRYMLAIALCDDEEFACIGKSYLHAYSASKDVHFSAHETSSSFSPDDFYLGADRCILLIIALLKRCARMLDAADEALFKEICAVSQWNDATTKMIREFKRPVMGVGDYVITREGNLGRVTDRSKSKYGFHSFEIEYIDDPLIPEITRDWFASFELRFSFSAAVIMAQAKAVLAAHGGVARELSEEESRRLTDEAARETWRAVKGLRQDSH